MGLIAGPDNPPVTRPNLDFRVWTSMLIAWYVFATVSASAPASSAALAIAPMSVTFGESLTHKGRRAVWRAADTTSETIWGSLPNWMPPCAVLGQEILSS